ncbi:MAG: hypothetical protein IJI92_01180 [Erysipelotrichaceae bacterium]|nr:hypothetical protein [Erysipelotrichaceae bacterium]
MKRVLKQLIAILVILMSFTQVINADMGPKPSVTVTINDPPEGKYYVTLLASTDGYGPWYRISEADIDNVTDPEEKAAWQAFHDAEDDFFFLNQVSECSDDNTFTWTYYPPEVFRIAIYSVKDRKAVVSEVIKKEAFDAFYDVSYGNELKVKEDARLGHEVLMFLIRISATVLIEVLIGLAFGYRSKKEIKTIIITNLLTQVILNLFMSFMSYYSGGMVWLILFPIAELVIMVFELIVYLFRMKGHKWYKTLIYTLLANAITLYLGLWLGFL